MLKTCFLAAILTCALALSPLAVGAQPAPAAPHAGPMATAHPGHRHREDGDRHHHHRHHHHHHHHHHYNDGGGRG